MAFSSTRVQARATTDKSQILSPQMSANFKNLTRQFDNRDHEKAIRTADQILAAFPEHGDTMAVKAASLHALDKKDGPDGAYALVKLGITKNMRGTLPWHSYAIMCRNDKNFAEALKCYKRAFSFDPENSNISRDLSSVCIHQRDWESFTDVREKMLNQKSDVRANWIGVALGHFMLKNYDIAAAIFNTTMEIMDAGDKDAPVEASQTVLFRAELALLRGKGAEALELLRTHSSLVIDKTELLTQQAAAHAMAGEKAAADAAYKKLIAQGIASRDHTYTLAKLRGVVFDEDFVPTTPAHATKFLAILDELCASIPRFDVGARLALDAVPASDADGFRRRLDGYCRPMVIKTIPSLLSVVKSLYTNPAKVAVIEELFLGWAAELEANKYEAFGGETNPAMLLWVYAFLGQHFLRKRDFAQAHAFVDKAVDHTPTVEMVYILRGKILHREGKLLEAAKTVDFARELDLQDKYVNGKAIKYMLRAGLIDEAEALLGLFYKKSPVNDGYLTAFESQCAWFERELGDAFLKRGDPVSALQCYLLWEKHQRDNHEELFDFHQYAIRRCAMKFWVDVLQREDDLSLNKIWLRVAPCIVRAYLKVHAMGEEAARAAHVPRPEIPPTGKADEDKARNERIKSFVLTVDLTEPLKKSQRFVQALLHRRPNAVDTHVVAFDYYAACGQLLGCGRALLNLDRLKAAQFAETKQRFKALVAASTTTHPEVTKALASIACLA